MHLGISRICVRPPKNGFQRGLPNENAKVQRVLCHHAQEPTDPIVCGILIDGRLIQRIDQSLDERWRYAVADSDLTLPVQNGRIL